MRYVVVLMMSAILILTSQPCAYAKDAMIDKLKVTSSAFKDGEMIPKRYSGCGENVSPDINWSKPPIGTEYIAVICEDPDAPVGIWTHWVVFNIPHKKHGLTEKMPPRGVLDDGTIQGTNDFNKIGYDGPHPPFGTHRYYFKVYALDMRLNIAAPVTREDLLKAMEGNVLAEGSLMGRYSK